jgi:hypothetical protein
LTKDRKKRVKERRRGQVLPYIQKVHLYRTGLGKMPYLMTDKSCVPE